MTVTVQEAIYRAKVEGQQAVDNLARSVDGLTVAEEKLTRATRASEQGFERLVAKVDPAARAQQQYQRTIEQVARYEAAGIGSMQQRAQVIQLATARFEQQTRALNIGAAANDNFAARTGLAGYAVRNLGFQLNDVATMLAMGASPFQVLASQGGQVYQILGSSERGVGGAIKGMAASVAAFLGPLGMLAAGLTAAAAAGYAFYTLTKKEGPTSEKLLEEHARLLGVIKSAYDNATHATKNWYEQSKEVTQLQLLQQQLDLTDKLRESTGKLIQTTLKKDFASFFGFGDPEIAKKFQPFADAIYTANEALQAGQPAVRGFVDEVARIGLANPELQKMASELIASAKNAGEFELKLKQIRDMLTLINGGKLSGKQRQGLGLGGGAAPQVNAYEQLIQKTKDRVEQLKLEAQGYGKTTEEVIKLKLQQEAERAARQAGVPVNQKVIDQLGDEVVLLEKQKKLRGLQDNIKFDRDTMFFSDREREIAREMKNLYGPEWQANMDSVEAKQLRINDAMKEMRDTTADFAKTFVQGMMDGKSASQALIGALDQLGKKMMSQGIDRAVNGLFSGNPAEMIGGGIQAAVGWGLQQFQKREQEKRAAAEAALEAERKADDLRRSRRAITEQYTLRKSLVGLDETQQGDALAAFDLRAANEMLQARRLPGNLKKDQILLIEETLAAERLKIIEDFAKRAAEIERSYEDRIFAATNDTSTLEGSLAAFDRAAAREREQAVEQGGIAIGKLEEALAAERLRLIEDFVGKANMAESRRLGYADRLFAATNDTSTLEGQLALFDRQAQRDREQEIANGGEAINELEAALAAERLQIIQQFVDQASAASARLQSYQDRLFAATNDTSTLAGQLAAFDRQAQRDREAEIAAGGEAILELEAALNAERLNVIQQFNSRIVDDTKQAEEQRRQALIQTTQQVLQYIQQLQTGTQSPLSPGARLAAAQASYDSTRALAMGGNAEAYAQFTQVAESLRQAAKDMYGSAAGYQTIFNNIVADGLNLTAPVAASDPVVAKLQEVVTAIGVANGSIVASTNGNVAAINAVTGAVNTQGNAASVYHNNTRLAVVGTTTAVDLTRTAVGATTTAVGANATTVSSAVGATTTAVGATTTAVNTNNNLVTTGNTIANDQLTEAQQAEALLNAIKGLGDIQRAIGNAAADQAADIGTQTVFKLTQINRALDNQAGGSSGAWDWLGFESGGVVGNGRWGRDSVMARYAGGGNIMLAGGEGVLTAGATAAIGGRAAIDYINRTGMMPANDNGGVVVAIENMNRNMSALLARIASLEEKNAALTAKLIEQNSEWQQSDQRQNKVAAPKVSRAA